MPLRNIRSGDLTKTAALPNGALSTSTPAIETNNGPNDQFLDDVEFIVEAPALLTAAMPDAKTMIYKLEDSADGVSWATVHGEIMRQVGAGGAGCVAKSQRFRVPTNIRKFIRVTAIASGSGNASGSNFTLAALY